VITDAALDKIILAVREPVTLEREELRREIEIAATQYRDAVIFHDLGRARNLEKRLTAFRKAAERLDAQLADETFYNLIEGTLIIHDLDPRSADTVRCAIKQLIKAADLVGKPPPCAISTAAPRGIFEVSPKEWLAGWRLPEIYERIFGRRSGRSRNLDGDPSGPCVRFIKAVMHELQIEYSEESIVRALTKRRAATRKK
jgi:hypothetical protein